MIFHNTKELRKKGTKIGITFGAWDLLHTGHIAMLAEAKDHCDYLICGMQTDPSIDRPTTKNAPVQSLVERQIQLSAVRFVDDIVVYQTEKELEDILLTIPIDVRILGIEYKGLEFTGKDICERGNIEIIYNSRDHSFSSSDLRKRVSRAELITTLNKENKNEFPKG